MGGLQASAKVFCVGCHLKQLGHEIMPPFGSMVRKKKQKLRKSSSQVNSRKPLWVLGKYLYTDTLRFLRPNTVVSCVLVETLLFVANKSNAYKKAGLNLKRWRENRLHKAQIQVFQEFAAVFCPIVSAADESSHTLVILWLVLPLTKFVVRMRGCGRAHVN